MKKAVTKLIGKQRPQESSFRIEHGSVEDFYIALDDPHKHFVAGDEISGQVILLSKKNLANIFITFSLCGYVKINASPQSKLRSMKHVLFNHTIKIYGPDLDLGAGRDSHRALVNGLDKGEHRFPFVVRLPHKKIYTSLDFGKGAILYVLRTNMSTVESAMMTLRSSPNCSGDSTSALMKTLSKLHRPSYSYEKTINLISPVDVAIYSEPKLKKLTIKDPKRGRHSRVQSSNCTMGTVATHSSNNSDSDSVRNNGQSANSPNTVASPNSPENDSNIRVVMEVAHGGFLRGELIPIKLFINHLKKIQDTRGIIVTLVRVCRIDYGPDGSYESFRKDLQQSVIPLYVDPVTLSSEISTSLRVPPDAFPTISGCPMVSFSYFIEVMLNLSGKPLSLEPPPEEPKSSIIPHEETQGASPGTPSGGSFNFHSYSQSRSDYINTDKYKRSKKFLQMTMEIVIGNHRSERANLASNNSIRCSSTSSSSHGQSSPANHGANPSNSRPAQPLIGAVHELQEVYDSTPPYTNGDTRHASGNASSLVEEAPYPSGNTASTNISLPNGRAPGVPSYDEIAVPRPDVQILSEKQQMLQHEASLLPSEPQFDDDSDSDDPLPTSANSPTLTGNIVSSLEKPNQSDNSQNIESVDYFNMPNDEDELYDIPDIHEGIGSEGDKDYVPNYSDAANDLLVKQRSQRSEEANEH